MKAMREEKPFQLKDLTILKRDFYMQDTREVAKKLLGSFLVRKLGAELLVGEIVETEAYLGVKDPCCHSFKGRKTERTKMMYLKGGHSYVYFTYGMHYCFNVVTGSEEKPEAVLIRALKPLQGLSRMKKNRKKENPLHLLSGPAKLCQAFHIDKSLNGMDLTKDKSFFIARGQKNPPFSSSPRIGLSLKKEGALWPLRFFVKKSPYVSCL